MSDWQTFGTVATTAGFTSVAYSTAIAIVGGYKVYGSPYTSLSQAEKKLERVRSRLQGLSPQRREEIENAIRSNVSDFKSLEDLEGQLDECVLLIDRSLSNFKFTPDSPVS
jgi:hypothetical protein